MTPVRYGPATRGDMELLAQYLITPPPSKSSTSVAAPLGRQFHDLNVAGVMDAFYRPLQEAIFVRLQDDESSFLDAQDWHGKLLESEKKLLDSVKRFILHTAIYCSRANDFAFPRYNDDKSLEASRLEKVDCLRDFVMDIIASARFLKDSGASEPGELPSLKDFLRERIIKLDALAKEGKREPRRYFFRPNSERTTHIYARRICCVILGLTDDYDQLPEFGLTHWKMQVFAFDNLEQLLWKGFGLKFKIDKRELEGLTGSIVDLDANFISTGPFKFVPTARPQEHLTLNREDEIRIYVSNALASTAYMFQNHIVAQYLHLLCCLIDRAAGISDLGLEICRSHALLFLQTHSLRSRRLAHNLHLDLGRVYLAAQVQPLEFKMIFYDALEYNIPRLEDFVLLRPRLAELQREMNDWRPQKIPHLFKRGYKDPLTWYGFWFAAIVGTIGILSLGVSVAQLVGQFTG
jgi:hypothetical protein